ncbi:hypothetical protein ACE1TI_20350 [Alteribacillus sp. JSM 102045]|uniref:hypothetical protein n=1 Tax=Alteribacillus sp. JSM 102045 TaxID=1562101 RepID=UPI0035BF2EAE
MAFSVFFLASWLVISLFLVMKKKLSIIENTFVFMVILVININWSWIIEEELNLIQLTEEGMDFTAFLLFRSIIIPMILNLIHLSNTLLVSIVSLIILLFLAFLSTTFNMTNYINWNLGYDAIYYIILHVISYYTHKLFQKISNNEVRHA